jgi:hypothetical protein
VSTTLAVSCSPVLTTPAINPCHGFSVIASVVDTSDKFIAGVIDTSKKLATGPLIGVCEVSMDAPFHGSSNETIGYRRYCRYGLK